MKKTLPLAFAAATALFLASCSKSSSSSARAPAGGVLTVQATDAFLAHARVDEARIELTAIYVAGGAGTDMQTLHEGTPIDVVLTDLRSGITAELSSTLIPEDTYTDVYLEVTGGYLRLENGKEFSTALGNMTLPNAAGPMHQFIYPAVPLSSAGGTLLLDFDLTRSFGPVPPGDPLNATSFDLTPTLRAVDLDRTGTLQGLVSFETGGALIPVEKADVYVLPPGLDQMATSFPYRDQGSSVLTTTASDSAGTFKFLGLEDGTYDLLAETDNGRAFAPGVQVTAGLSTSVDLVLEQ